MTPELRREYLAALGLTSWRARAPAAPVAPAPAGTAAAAATTRARTAAPAATTAPAATAVSAVPNAVREAVSPAVPREGLCDWNELRTRVAACTRCALSATRTQTVFGVGNPQADWLIVGEAPGAEEDRQGEPFVGRAGQLLNAMLHALGLKRTEVYIANVLKCRPPGNRDPSPAESAECLPYLERQIALLKPKILLSVGRIAAQNLLRTDAPLSRLRGQVHAFGEARVPVVATYHPAYLLRSPSYKRQAWEDLKFAREVCARVER